MGFLSYHNSTPNPAQVYYRWSGGLKNVTLPDGTEAKQLKGELAFFNGDEMEKVELPFVFCALDQSFSVTGFNPSGNTRFYSNEFTSMNEPVRVTRQSEDGGAEVIAEDTYSHLKGHLPEGAKLQTNLYIYNPATDRIERINLKGSALSAWIDFGKKNKGIYTHAIRMEVGEKKTVGTVDFLPPKFIIDTEYSKEDIKKLEAQATIVQEYLTSKRKSNMEGNSEMDSDDKVDQTPAQYDGEQSQEQSIPSEDGGLTLTAVPF